MGSGQQIIQVLDIALLIVGILVGGRVFFLLGDVRKTVVGIESTRAEISTTLKRVESVADATEHVLREELAPTLKSARDALANIDVSAKALAETTLIVRKAAGAVEDAQRFLSATGPIGQAIRKKVGGLAGGLLYGISHGLKSVLGKSKSSPKPQIAPAPEQTVAIPGTESTNPVLHADTSESAEPKSVPKRK